MKRLFVLATVLVLLVVMVSSVAVVGASQSQAISGDWQFVSLTPISAQPVDGNCIIELAYTQNYQGDLVGSVTGQVRIVHLGPCDQPAAEVFHTQGTFQGTVTGTSGTFDFQGEGKADAQGNLQGQFIIQQGTGELANLRGMFTLTGNVVAGSGTYSGDIHFDPA
jgi:hypothetical protein